MILPFRGQKISRKFSWSAEQSIQVARNYRYLYFLVSFYKAIIRSHTESDFDLDLLVEADRQVFSQYPRLDCFKLRSKQKLCNQPSEISSSLDWLQWSAVLIVRWESHVHVYCLDRSVKLKSPLSLIAVSGATFCLAIISDRKLYNIKKITKLPYENDIIRRWRNNRSKKCTIMKLENGTFGLQLSYTSCSHKFTFKNKGSGFTKI